MSITGNISSVGEELCLADPGPSIYIPWLLYLFPTSHSCELSQSVTMSAEKSTHSLDKQVTPTETEHVEVLPTESTHNETYDNHGATDVETGDGGAYSAVSLYYYITPRPRYI